MRLVPVRELQQHASAVLRHVRAGERVGVTDRGVLVAVISPPAEVGGAAALIAAGRVRPAKRRIGSEPPPARRAAPIQAVLDDLRSDRG
jgi:prevent-host-death family protein